MQELTIIYQAIGMGLAAQRGAAFVTPTAKWAEVGQQGVRISAL